MQNHLELSDAAFELQFKNCEFPAALFSHEAHLRLAWIHIQRYGVEQAVANVCTQLQAYVQHLGAADKYNETLTIAAVRAVYHFTLKTEFSGFQDFMAQNPRLKHNFRELIFKHYQTDIFNSETAKKQYLEPELLPFD